MARHEKNFPWIMSFGVIIAFWVIISTALFYNLQDFGQNSENRLYNWFSSFYFTIMNMTTGFPDDITPKTVLVKIVAIANSLIGLVAFGIFVAVLTAALQPS